MVGQDWGGPIGLYWATRHPERVRSLFILNTFAHRPRRKVELPIPLILDDRGATLAVLLESIAALHRSGFVSVDESCLTCDHYRPGTQVGYCELLAMDLAPIALRVHCPDHTPVPA